MGDRNLRKNKIRRMLMAARLAAAGGARSAGGRVWESSNILGGGARAVLAQRRSVFAASWRGESRALASMAARRPGGARRLPPPEVDDMELREVTGTMQIPELLRQRALTALRHEGGKQRVGLEKMVTRSRFFSPPPSTAR